MNREPSDCGWFYDDQSLDQDSIQDIRSAYGRPQPCEEAYDQYLALSDEEILG